MDSIDKIVLCMQLAAQQEKHSVPSSQAVKNIIGLSLTAAMQQLFPLLSVSQQSSMVAAYRQQYQLHQSILTPLYKGVHTLLTELKSAGYILAVATGKGRNGLDRMLEQSDTKHLFSATICADEANSKPDPLMLDLLLSQLRVKASEALMVGDSCYDLAMAVNAGVKSVGVSYGVHQREALSMYQPLAIVDCLATELFDCL